MMETTSPIDIRHTNVQVAARHHAPAFWLRIDAPYDRSVSSAVFRKANESHAGRERLTGLKAVGKLAAPARLEC